MVLKTLAIGVCFLISTLFAEGYPRNFLNPFSCGENLAVDTCNVAIKAGDSLSTLCSDLAINLAQTSADYGLILYYQANCGIPDVTIKFDNPGSNISVVKQSQGLDNSSISLSSAVLPSSTPCGKGFLIAVVFFKANGTFVEYLSLPIDVACNSPVDISLNGTTSFLKNVPVVLAGGNNPFATAGVTDVSINLQPSNATINCDISVVALMQCQQICDYPATSPTPQGPNTMPPPVDPIPGMSTPSPMSIPSRGPTYGDLMKMHYQELYDSTSKQIILDRTFVPAGASGSCKMTLMLDPLQMCPDMNKGNNKLEIQVIVDDTNKTATTNGSEKSTCNVIPNFISGGRDAFFVQRQGSCEKSAEVTIYKSGHFIPGSEKTSSMIVGLITADKMIDSSSLCKDRCTKLYKNYTVTKNSCPKSLFEPLLQFFVQSNAAWQSTTTDNAELQASLENMQAIAKANADIMDKIVNDDAYSKFCSEITKLLFETYNSMSRQGGYPGRGGMFQGFSGGEEAMQKNFPGNRRGGRRNRGWRGQRNNTAGLRDADSMIESILGVFKNKGMIPPDSTNKVFNQSGGTLGMSSQSLLSNIANVLGANGFFGNRSQDMENQSRKALENIFGAFDKARMFGYSSIQNFNFSRPLKDKNNVEMNGTQLIDEVLEIFGDQNGNGGLQRRKRGVSQRGMAEFYHGRLRNMKDRARRRFQATMQQRQNVWRSNPQPGMGPGQGSANNSGRGFGRGSRRNWMSRDQRHDLLSKTFPFGLWFWGLPDLGFVSGRTNCGSAGRKNCRGSMSLMDTWYADCICPWVWTGKSKKCPVGDELSSSVGKATVLYLKEELDVFPMEGIFSRFFNFTKRIRSAPIEISDVDALFTSLIDLATKEANETSNVALLQSYLQNLSPEFKQSIVDVIKYIQGLVMFDSDTCDWSGKPGSAPTSDELCRVQTGRYVQMRLQCLMENQISTDQGPQCQEADGANDLPIVWRKVGQTFKKGSYCPVTGQWLWTDVASCGGGQRKCNSCSDQGSFGTPALNWNSRGTREGMNGPSGLGSSQYLIGSQGQNHGAATNANSGNGKSGKKGHKKEGKQNSNPSN